MKLLLYCTKIKPFLINDCGNFDLDNRGYNYYWKKGMIAPEHLNGKIVAECDFEIEEIKYHFGYYDMGEWAESYILENSCLTAKELDNYLQASKEYDEAKVSRVYGYAIHIKNLHIFDEPKELSDYNKRIGDDFQVLGNAPQNMMKCCKLKYMIEDYILISIRPEWLCKILNGEKTIDVRKKVLKEMKNDTK